MATEIERKFLVLGDQWKNQAIRSIPMRQGYLGEPKRASIRVRTAGDHAYLNVKSATLGVTRKEYEVPLDVQDANEILDSLCEGPIIEKTRYYVPYGNHTWEVDVFHGDNEGLIVAEIELESEQQSFDKPSWLGMEVSSDPRYYNVSLVKLPYKLW